MSIADKLTYLNTTKQLLKTEINKINNVLDDNSTFRSYPQELFNGYLDILNNGTDTLWNNLEKVSQTGTEAVLEGVETAPMKMVLNGNTSQDGTPTPDTPVEVKVVTGKNVVSVSGKNLFDKNNVLSTYKSRIEMLDTGVKVIILKSYTTSFALFKIGGKELLGKTITIKRDIANSSSNNGRIRLFYGNNNNATISTIVTLTTSGSSNVTLENNFPNDTDGIFLGLYATFNNQQEADVYTDFTDLQVELGSTPTPTPYVPYSKTDYPINLGNLELCKIGDYKDYLFKRNGKWYVHKEIGKVVLNGSENWSVEGSTDDTNTFKTYLSSRIKVSNLALCNILTRATGVTETFAWLAGGGATFIKIYKTRASDVSSFKNWLSTNNAIIYYVLATPTDTEITNTTLIEQLEAIYKAKSVKDKTYITQTNDDLPFILDVEAIKEYSVE